MRNSSKVRKTTRTLLKNRFKDRKITDYFNIKSKSDNLREEEYEIVNSSDSILARELGFNDLQSYSEYEVESYNSPTKEFLNCDVDNSEMIKYFKSKEFNEKMENDFERTKSLFDEETIKIIHECFRKKFSFHKYQIRVLKECFEKRNRTSHDNLSKIIAKCFIKLKNEFSDDIILNLEKDFGFKLNLSQEEEIIIISACFLKQFETSLVTMLKKLEFVFNNEGSIPDDEIFKVSSLCFKQLKNIINDEICKVLLEYDKIDEKYLF